jgi:hypothetical protein
MFKAMARPLSYEPIQNVGFEAVFDYGLLVIKDNHLQISVSVAPKHTFVTIDCDNQHASFNLDNGVRAKIDVGGLNGYTCLFAAGEQSCYVQIDPIEIMRTYREEYLISDRKF